MKIRHISVRNFRGIRELDWAVNSDMVCLIGSSNSCKSTILDAIGYALSPRWNLVFTDDDFHHGNASETIVIEITLGDPPKRLLSEASFGLYARGWRREQLSITDEPEEGTEIVLTIQLTVDASLEPEWRVIADRHAEGKIISAKDREALGVSSLGDYLDRDLSWARGSALSRVSSGQEGISSMLAEAARTIRHSVSNTDLVTLRNSAKSLGEDASEAGVGVYDDLRPGLDLRSIGLTASVLCLFDGDVPLRQSGLGVRRLIALVMQKKLAKEGAILLVDELEQALEPFRLRHLIRYLRPGNAPYQVFSCTHSPIALAEHKAQEIHVVRRNPDGLVTVIQASETLQGALRALSEALFCTKVVLCEGSTEWGFSRALERYWTTQGRESLAYMNAAFAYAPSGSGSSMPGYARDIAFLGYDTAFWCDADAPLKPSADELQSLGIKIVQCSDGLAIEEQLCLDVPLGCLDELVWLAFGTSKDGEVSVREAIASKFASDNRDFTSISEFECPGVTVLEIRLAIGKAAKDKKWFKTTDAGELLGEIVVKHLADMAATDTACRIADLEQWIYG